MFPNLFIVVMLYTVYCSDYKFLSPRPFHSTDMGATNKKKTKKTVSNNRANTSRTEITFGKAKCTRLIIQELKGPDAVRKWMEDEMFGRKIALESAESSRYPAGIYLQTP
jgi:hypothetical protein